MRVKASERHLADGNDQCSWTLDCCYSYHYHRGDSQRHWPVFKEVPGRKTIHTKTGKEASGVTGSSRSSKARRNLQGQMIRCCGQTGVC